MKLSSREDIEAPIDHVFAHVADFDAIERQVLRRGVDLARADTDGQGRAWVARFDYRGKPRECAASIADLDHPNGYTVNGTVGGLEAVFRVDLVALSRNRTRVVAGLDMRPRTLSARLLVQSMKLGKSRLERRFAKRLSEAARVIGDRYSPGP